MCVLCLHVCVQVHVEARERNECLFQLFFTLRGTWVLRHGFSLSLEFTNLSRLSGWEVVGIHLSLSLQC